MNSQMGMQNNQNMRKAVPNKNLKELIAMSQQNAQAINQPNPVKQSSNRNRFN